MKFNYQKICEDLLSNLNEKEKEVISRRFGLRGDKRETLDSIGQDFEVCRERIRQIEEGAFEKIKPRAKKNKNLYQHFLSYFKKKGGVKRENVLLEDLGEGKCQNEVYFLLNLKEPFQRIREDENFHSFWTTNQKSIDFAQKAVSDVCQKLQKTKKLSSLEELNSRLKKDSIESYLEISKSIQKNENQLYGLSFWPEINPRGIKDRAYLIFKKTEKPLHFSRVADLIKGANLQTVHNELIRDPRFVLIGRGIYGLTEWGYISGTVKEVIFAILKEEGPLAKNEILKRALKQRQVKENTVLLNLSNKKYFLRDNNGRYGIKKTEII